MRYLLFLLLVLGATLPACDSAEPEPAPPGPISEVDLVGEYVGSWGEPNGTTSYTLSLGLVVNDGVVLGSGSILRLQAIGGGFEEATRSVIGISGGFERDSTVTLQARFAMGQVVVLRGTYSADLNALSGRLSGASPFGPIAEDEFVLQRVEE